MLYEDFYSQFVASYNEGDIASANKALMKELANILIRNRQDFIDLLNEAEIPATADMGDVTLVDLFVENINKNKALVLGASMLVNMHNKQMGFDGEEELSDEGVKAGYEVMCSYFGGDEQYSYIDPITIGAIAGVAKGGLALTDTIAKGKQKKKYGAMEAATKQQEAKAAITQQLLAARKAEQENATKRAAQKSKNTRILLIVGGSIAVVAALGITWYLVSKRNK